MSSRKSKHLFTIHYTWSLDGQPRNNTTVEFGISQEHAERVFQRRHPHVQVTPPPSDPLVLSAPSTPSL